MFFVRRYIIIYVTSEWNENLLILQNFIKTKQKQEFTKVDRKNLKERERELDRQEE